MFFLVQAESKSPGFLLKVMRCLSFRIMM